MGLERHPPAKRLEEVVLIEQPQEVGESHREPAYVHVYVYVCVYVYVYVHVYVQEVGESHREPVICEEGVATILLQVILGGEHRVDKREREGGDCHIEELEVLVLGPAVRVWAWAWAWAWVRVRCRGRFRGRFRGRVPEDWGLVWGQV